MHHEPTDEIRETASLWSLGALPAGESIAFEGHIAGCEVCRAEARACEEIAATLAGAVPEESPAESLRTRILDRTRPPSPGMHVLRNDEGTWKQSPFPGISAKRLYLDPDTRVATFLLRMQPGASYPPHRHKAVEQCLVLEGDVRLDRTVLGPGDYSRNDALSNHGTLQTEGGCLLMLMASVEDELL